MSGDPTGTFSSPAPGGAPSFSSPPPDFPPPPANDSPGLPQPTFLPVYFFPPSLDHEPPKETIWPVAVGRPYSASIETLKDFLGRTDETQQAHLAQITNEQFMRQYCLLPAQRVDEVGSKWEPVPGAQPVLWSAQAQSREDIAIFLRQQTEDDRKAIARMQREEQSGGARPDPEPVDQRHAMVDTADIPMHNAVAVSGELPMQVLTVGALTWRNSARRPQTGITSAPVSTATMCPSCGRAFAMRIPAEILKKQQLANPDLERRLDSALDAQRLVLESETTILKQEQSDLGSALSAINTSLGEAREDGDTLGQLAESQLAWVTWLEQEIRQTKAEIAQLGEDFQQCLASNRQLEKTVDQACAERAQRDASANVGRYPGLPAGRVGAAGGAAPPRAGSAPPAGPSGAVDWDPAGYRAAPRAASAAPVHARTPAQSEARRAHMRDKIARFYERHQPTKLALVDTLIDEFDGKERELLSLMAQKYGDASVLQYDPVIDAPELTWPGVAAPSAAAAARSPPAADPLAGIPPGSPPAGARSPAWRARPPAPDVTPGLSQAGRRPKATDRIGDLLSGMLAQPDAPRVGAAAPPSPLPSIPPLRGAVPTPERYSHLRSTERDLLEHYRTVVDRAVDGAAPPAAALSPPAAPPHRAPSLSPEPAASAGAAPSSVSASRDGSQRGLVREGSSSQSRVTFDLGRRARSPYQQQDEDDELRRVAPSTYAARRQGRQPYR